MRAGPQALLPRDTQDTQAEATESQPSSLRSKGQGCRETWSSHSCPGSPPCPPHPAGPSWGQHWKAGVSEAPSCQVCRLLSLQSLNFKLDRDCEVPKGREQERHLRGRGPGSWASGARGLDPGPAQLSVSAGNALSTASLRSPQPWVTTPVVCSATCRHPGHWANREEARRIHLAW